MHYFVGYNSQIHKYVLLDYDLNWIAEFEWARDLFDYCDQNNYKYAIL
jgi:hypothetical protein